MSEYVWPPSIPHNLQACLTENCPHPDHRILKFWQSQDSFTPPPTGFYSPAEAEALVLQRMREDTGAKVSQPQE